MLRVPFRSNASQPPLWLDVENKNKFIRGKKRAKENIESFDLARYEPVKTKDDGEYLLTIPHETDKELDEIINELIGDMASTADSRNCFIDARISTLDKEKHWD